MAVARTSAELPSSISNPIALPVPHRTIRSSIARRSVGEERKNCARRDVTHQARAIITKVDDSLALLIQQNGRIKQIERQDRLFHIDEHAMGVEDLHFAAFDVRGAEDAVLFGALCRCQLQSHIFSSLYGLHTPKFAADQPCSAGMDLLEFSTGADRVEEVRARRLRRVVRVICIAETVEASTSA